MKKLLREERHEQEGTILSKLQDILHEMEVGDYSTADAAVLITRDKGTGIITIAHMTENGTSDAKVLFHDAARIHGYARLQ